MEENVFNSVEIIEDGRAFLIGNASSFESYYIRSDYTDDEDLHNACVLMYRQWRMDEEHLYLNFYPNHGFILYGQKDLGDGVYGFDADSVYTGQWMVDGDTVSLFWDDGTEDTAVLIPNEHPGDVGEDVSTPESERHRPALQQQVVNDEKTNRRSAGGISDPAAGVGHPSGSGNAVG